LIEELERTAEHAATATRSGRVTWRMWGSGRPLVLVHGASGSWMHWVRNIEALSRHRRLLVPDLPGFGDSELRCELTSAEDITDVMSRALEELVPRPTSFDVAGFSFGGIIAGLLAAQARTRVHDLVLIGAGGMGMDVTRPGDLRRPPRDGSPEALAAVERHNVAQLFIAEPDHVDELAVQVYRENVRRSRFRTGAIPSSGALAEELGNLAARLTVVYGERDAFALGQLEARRRVVLEAQPSAAFHVIQGAGHWVNYEAAEDINRLLVQVFACSR
jgi:2-hydroxy-6-oxonona-2,4-dienedioate hydrolase